MKRVLPAAISLAAIFALGACGGTTTVTVPASTHSPAPATAPSPTPAAALACSTAVASGSTAQSDISTLVQDQKSQDKSLEQNWVLLVPDSSGNDLTSQGQDLQNAVTDFTPYTSGSTKLASDASSFVTDASTFISDQSSGLYPGWVSEYRAVEHDIHYLAADCGMAWPLPSGE